MKNIIFEQDELKGSEIFRLKGGTKYLPSVYIQNNENWNKWMVFDSRTHEVVTNRTFQSKDDCIKFIQTYDNQSESILSSLYEDIKDPELRVLVKQIDLSNPKQVTPVTSEDNLDLIVHSQKLEIAESDNVDIRQVKLVSCFYNGLVSLFIKDTGNPDERIFYIFNNGSISSYSPWKTLSVAMALINSLSVYSDERIQYKKLKELNGRTFISVNGHGFVFDKHISNTNMIFAQKVRVTQVNDSKVADPNSPLTPMFVCKIQLEDGVINLTIINHFSDNSEKTEPYIIRL